MALAVISGILLTFTFLLAIPVDLIFNFERDEESASGLAIRWFFGLVGKEISPPQKKKKKKDRKKRKRKGKGKHVFAMARSEGFIKRCIRLVRDVLGKVDVREFKLYLKVGLSSPADTGLLFAAAYPALISLRSFTSLDFQVEPDFHGESLRGFLKGNVRIVPIQIMGRFFLFALSPQTLKAIKAYFSAGRR